MSDEITIKQCSIVLTRGCNLRCNFCYVKNAGYEVDDHIEFDNLKKIVDFCCEAKVKFIFFTGGEPLTYQRLPEILNYITTREHPITTAIATNGILLKNMDLCKALINNGLGYIDVSMKGKDAQEWRKITGFDGSAAQRQAIRNLASLPIDFTCSMVVTPENVYSVCEAVQAAHDNGAKQFSFTFTIDNNGAGEPEMVYLRKNDPIKLIDDFLSQSNRLSAICNDWWIEYSFPMCVYTKEQIEQLRGRLATPCQVHLQNAVTFSTKMELLPCDMYFDKPLGQYGKDFSSYKEFLSLTKSERYSTTMEKIRELPSPECVSCEYYDRCFGGCPVLWKNYSFVALKEFQNNRTIR